MQDKIQIRNIEADIASAKHKIKQCRIRIELDTGKLDRHIERLGSLKEKLKVVKKDGIL